LIFPTLLIELTNNNPYNDVNIFEFGGWSLPIFIVNSIFLIFYFLQKNSKLPLPFKKLIKYIENNDISKRTTLVILFVMFGIYLLFSIDELGREEFELGDYRGIPDYVKKIQFSEKILSPDLRYVLLHVSYVVFDNLRILPLMASISLLLLTYFITVEISKKRLAGIVAFFILLQSNLFLLFDTTSVYENFWTAFYFLSLYLIFKKPVVSHVAFFLSIVSKPISITLLPINFFAIKASEVTKRNKILLLVGYVFLILLILVAFATDNLTHTQNLELNKENFVTALNEFGNTLRFDGLILLLFFPTLLILKSKTKIIADKINFIFIALSFAMLSQPVMYFAIGMTLQPYRLIPLIVFAAISIGMIFTQTKKLDQL